MKKFLSLFAALVCATAALAQTPQQIINRMNETMKGLEPIGIAMEVEVHIPVIGTVISRVWSLHGKQKTVTTIGKKQQLEWIDGRTSWSYDVKSNTVSITEKDSPEDNTEANNRLGMFEDLTQGYDFSIKDENAEFWIFTCTRSKSNPDKDAPKKMELVVRKSDYHPIRLDYRMSLIRLSMRDFRFGLTDKDVTFDPAECPGATIKDYRK